MLFLTLVFELTESTLLSVIGVGSRLLEPLRRGSLRGRACGADQGACEFTGLWVLKSMLFLTLVFMKIWVRFGVPFGVPFWSKIRKSALLRRLLERLRKGFEKRGDFEGV